MCVQIGYDHVLSHPACQSQAEIFGRVEGRPGDLHRKKILWKKLLSILVMVPRELAQTISESQIKLN